MATVFLYTADLSPDFFDGIKDVADKLEANVRHLLGVMMSESGVMAKAHNPNGDASGLIQFMPQTLLNLGWRDGHAAFRALHATEQLPYVQAYFEPYKGKLVSVAAFYVATFLPALVSHAGDPDFVLTAKNGPLGWAYAPNASFDKNMDLAITVQELGDAVSRNCRGPRWSEILQRLDDAGDPSPDTKPDPDQPIDLRTTQGIQCALVKLGYDPGRVDGLLGQQTRTAVVAYQTDVGLVPDGMVGPLTRASLAAQLASRAG